MSETPTSSGFENLLPEDLAALVALQRGNQWLRAVLCTLARRGVALRKSDQERARQLIFTFARLPYYKAGQFLFDLMEWEDFMLDGPAPDIVPTALDAAALRRLANFLRTVQTGLDSAAPSAREPVDLSSLFGITGLDVQFKTAAQVPLNENLPELEAGFYLYQDVVLGIYLSLLHQLESTKTE